MNGVDLLLAVSLLIVILVVGGWIADHGYLDRWLS